MTCAYDQTLLKKARRSLARMFDYAVYVQKLPLETFYQMFLGSDISEGFARGESSVVAGRSGAELAYMIISKEYPDIELIEPHNGVDRSPEYWVGWVLAYYQWMTGLNFQKISQFVSIQELLDMYPTYHEMDIRHLVETLEEKRADLPEKTALRRCRIYAGLTQQELADSTGIPLRTLQEYEQGRKNINKAQVDYVVKLSKALYCGVEDLLEG